MSELAEPLKEVVVLCQDFMFLMSNK